jgi:hypothetical protein
MRGIVGLMAKCEVCGNDYHLAFEVTTAGHTDGGNGKNPVDRVGLADAPLSVRCGGSCDVDTK